MIDKILKIAMAAGVVCILGLTIQFARADDQCPNGVWSEQQKAFESVDGVSVQQLNADQIKSMVSKVGPPPNAAEGDFDTFLVVNGPLAAVFIVQNGCTTDRLGPSHVEAINSLLGIVRAKGERVD